MKTSIRRVNASLHATTFSFPISCQKLGISIKDAQHHIEEIERDLLSSFYQFYHQHQKAVWIHWCMKSIQYGFDVIQIRYSELCKKQFVINHDKLFDLAETLKDIYGHGYAGGDPRLPRIAELNGCNMNQFMDGKSEAIAAREGRYTQIACSCASKVHIFQFLAKRVLSNKLVIAS